MLVGYLCSRLALKNKSQVTARFFWVCGSGEGVSRGVWVRWSVFLHADSTAVCVRREGTSVHLRWPFPALATGTYAPMIGLKVSPRVRGPLPPFLLWSSFSPNSLDSRSFWVQAGHWAADASKAGQDGASGSPWSPRGVGQGPSPPGLVARASHLALECW